MTSLPSTSTSPGAARVPLGPARTRRPVTEVPVSWYLEGPPQTAHHHGRQTVWVVMATLVGVMVMLLVGVAGLTIAVTAEKSAAAEEIAFRAELDAGRAAQAAWVGVAGRYTTSRENLAAAGWTPATDADLHLVSATATGYCLSVGPVAGEPVMWATETGVGTEPCD